MNSMKVVSPSWKEFVIFFILLSSAVAVVFFPASTGAGLLYSGDFTGSDGLDLNLPLKVNLGEALRSFSLPLWTPDLMCGYPLLGEGQTGMFYPPSMLFSLLPPIWCFNGFIFFHIVIAGIGTYLYCRHKEMSWESAVISALSFSFCSFFILHARQLNLISSASWLPLLMLFAERQIATKRLYDVIPWALVLALQWLAGHPAMTYLTLFGISAIYGAAWAGMLLKDRSSIWFYPLSWAGGALLSGMLSALQILPTLELIPISKRVSLSFHSTSLYPFFPFHLYYLINPFFSGNPAMGTYPLDKIQTMGVFWENCIYVGMVPLLLALLALLFIRRDKRVLHGLLIILPAFILALGPQTPLYVMMWKAVPAFHLFRFPGRFLIFMMMGLSVLAGLGWERSVASGVSMGLRKGIWGLMILLMIANSRWFSSSFNAVVGSSWLDRPPTAAYRTDDREQCRIYTYASKYSWQKAFLDDRGWMGDCRNLNRYRDLLAPDYSMLFGISQSGEKTYIEGGMAPERRARLEEKLEAAMLSSFNGSLAIVPDEPLALLSMMNVRYIYSRFMLAHHALSRLSPPQDLEGVKVYRNRDARPRLFVTHRWRTVQSGEEVLEALFSPSFDPEEILLEEAWEPMPCCSGESKVISAVYGPRKIVAEIEMTGPGFLFISDTWYPGWKARVDGREVRILRAHYAFRAVPVSRGSHRVTMCYEPLSFNLGLLLSAAALLFVIIAWYKSLQKIH